MRKLLALLSLPLLLSACATQNQKNASTFLTFCATHNFSASNVMQETKAPWFTHTESISGMTKDAQQFTIADLKADLTIYAMGVPAASWHFSADNITIDKANLATLSTLAAPSQ